MKFLRLLIAVPILAFLISCNDSSDELVLTRTYTLAETSRACFTMEYPKDAFLFPVLPESDEWYALHEKGMDAVYNALRIPKSTLKKMSTAGLVQTFFDFPYSGDYGLSNYWDSYYRVFVRFMESGDIVKDIFSEMKKRDDIGTTILAFYKAYQYNRDYYRSSMIFEQLNLLASVENFQKLLSIEEKKELITLGLEKKSQGDPRLGLVSFMISRLLVSEKYSPIMELMKNGVQLKSFIDGDSDSLDIETEELIYSLANNFINK